MQQARKATRNAAGGELNEKQVEEEFTRIRDDQQCITREATRQTIKSYFEADDTEVTSKTVSLKCPISKARLEVPVRSVDCRHMECLDLRSYLDFHKRITFWQCPVQFCNVEVRCESLRVDQYMSDVLRDTENRRAGYRGPSLTGPYKAVQRPPPDVKIEDEDPYVQESGAEPRVKTEQSIKTPEEPVETDAFRTDEDQPQTSSLAAVDGASFAEGVEEQPRDAAWKVSSLNTRQRVAALLCDLASEKNRADSAESDASKLREKLAAKDHQIRELTAKNAELQAQLSVLRPAAEAIAQMNQAPTESGSSPINENPHVPSSSLAPEDASNDAAKAATDSGLSAQREPHLNHGGKRYKCGLCGKAFARYGGLRVHERRHIGEKPCKCNECGLAFAQVGELQRHMRTHTGERRYECNECGRAFAQWATLTRHKAHPHRGKALQMRRVRPYLHSAGHA
ncbi:hypothetical protein AAVH_10995 [Aphelenchoides avenae]|nr:hypothetical protein AAVH_10995 [Aphelenchus avenae]